MSNLCKTNGQLGPYLAISLPNLVVITILLHVGQVDFVHLATIISAADLPAFSSATLALYTRLPQ